jgi:release factor glutamine methyltransferase
MTLGEAINRLADSGISSAERDARAIFRYIGGVSPAALVFRDAVADTARVLGALEERASGRPLEYVIGSVDFYKENYLVSEDCLIPRDDTEILVDTAVRLIPRGARFVDLCTGSGCVALSVLNNTEMTSAVAVDISAPALEMARKNAERLSLSDRVELLLADAKGHAVCGEIFAVLSNPPYVTEAEYEHTPPEVKREPKIALVGGFDGLDFYRAITALYAKRIARGGFIAYETGYRQGKALTEIAALHGMSCEIIKDLSGNDRVALLRILQAF